MKAAGVRGCPEPVQVTAWACQCPVGPDPVRGPVCWVQLFTNVVLGGLGQLPTHVSQLPCGCQAAPASDVCHWMVQSEAVLMLEGFTVLRTAWSFELCACSTWIPMIFFDVLKHPRVTGSEPLGQGWICCCCYCWQDMGVAWWAWLCRSCGQGGQEVSGFGGIGTLGALSCLWGALPRCSPGVTGDWSLVLCFPGQLGEKQVPSPASDDRVKDEFSDLSEG